MTRKLLFASAVLFLFFTGCSPKNEYKKYLSDPLLYSNTVHELNSVVMGNNFPPMVASRNYAYAAIAGYEVIAAGYPDKYQSLSGQLNSFNFKIPVPDKNKPISFELAALLTYIKIGESVTFPEGSMKEYEDSILQVARDKGLPADVEKASREFSDTVSALIYKWSKGDNYARTRTEPKYNVIESDSSRWIPTPPGYFSAVEPHWKEIRPMALDSANQFKWPLPYNFDVKDKNSPYYNQVMLVKQRTDSLTDEQAWIADFWDDNAFKLNVSGHAMFGTKKFSPAGHWMGIIGIAAQKAHYDFAETVYAYAETSISLYDAFIECWWAKYVYNTVRPETVINRDFDPNWRPHLQTPAFPEYTCGHCTISGAAAETLTKTFGDNFSYTDSTELEFGIKSRSFTSFRQAADETRMSRFYGGIHFLYSTERGRDVGRAIGDYIAQKLKMRK